jgi:RNA polymerase sigma-70 factor (ECF subfamily)
MRDFTDEELMVMFKNGNTAAFDLLFDRYRAALFNFLFRMLGRMREPAEDLFQEIFMKVFKGRDFYEPTGKFSTWLYTIARNHCLNHIKSIEYQKNKGMVPLESVDEPGTEEKDETKSREDLHEELERAISSLPEQYRDVFLLREVEGLSHEEISRILNMNESTVRSSFHRARKQLKEKLESVLGRKE